jgi:hypothetical protein
MASAVSASRRCVLAEDVAGDVVQSSVAAAFSLPPLRRGRRAGAPGFRPATAASSAGSARRRRRVRSHHWQRPGAACTTPRCAPPRRSRSAGPTACCRTPAGAASTCPPPSRAPAPATAPSAPPAAVRSRTPVTANSGSTPGLRRSLEPSGNRLLARRPYDLRHAAVTLWLAARVPATEVARRAGHGVAVLLKGVRRLHRRPGRSRQPADQRRPRRTPASKHRGPGPDRAWIIQSEGRCLRDQGQHRRAAGQARC